MSNHNSFYLRGSLQHKDYPDLKVDGKPGLKTLNAVRSYYRRNGNVKNLLKEINGLQTARYIALGEGNEKLEDLEMDG